LGDHKDVMSGKKKKKGMPLGKKGLSVKKVHGGHDALKATGQKPSTWGSRGHIKRGGDYLEESRVYCLQERKVTGGKVRVEEQVVCVLFGRGGFAGGGRETSDGGDGSGKKGRNGRRNCHSTFGIEKGA